MLGYGYLEQMRDLLLPLALAAVMFLCVSAVGLLPLKAAVLLPVQVLCGVLVYGGLAAALRLEALTYLLEMLKTLCIRRRGVQGC